MKTQIKVTGFRETKTIIRLWTCYPHMLASGTIIDTDNFVREIDLPGKVFANDHVAVVSTIERLYRPGIHADSVVLAYQVVVCTSVKVDTTKYPPIQTEERWAELARWDEAVFTKKIFVHADQKIQTMSIEELQQEANWVKVHMKLAGHVRNGAAFDARNVNSLTGTAFDAFMERCKPDPQQSILKLNQATFVLLGPKVKYRPEPSLKASIHGTD